MNKPTTEREKAIQAVGHSVIWLVQAWLIAAKLTVAPEIPWGWVFFPAMIPLIILVLYFLYTITVMVLIIAGERINKI